MSFDFSDFTSVLRIEQPVAHVVVAGELDAFTAAQVDRQAAQARASGCTRLRVDLGEVTFIDAAGVGLLVRLRRTAHWPEETFEVVAASECVRRLCTLLDLAEVVGVEPAPWRTRPGRTGLPVARDAIAPDRIESKRPRLLWWRRRTMA